MGEFTNMSFVVFGAERVKKLFWNPTGTGSQASLRDMEANLARTMSELAQNAKDMEVQYISVKKLFQNNIIYVK